MDEKAKQTTDLNKLEEQLINWDGTLWLEPITVRRILEMPEADDKEALDALRSQTNTSVSKGQ